MKAVTKALAILSAAAVLFGCGGGGGGSTTGGGTAGNARVGIFVTDNLTNDYDHVWVNIRKVELNNANGGSVTVYDDATGRTVDLRALNDAGTQKFALLGEATIPAGNYKSVEITVDEALSLVPAGGTQALDKTFAGSANGLKQLEFNLAQGTVNGTQDIVADFDLSLWTVDGNLVNAVVVEGNDDNVNPGNQEAFQFAGTVSGLNGAAPNFTFDLVQGPWTLKVVTSASTAIFNNNGAANPTLANGTRVQVEGVFDTTTRTLTASEVKIKLVGENANEAEVEGAVSNITADGFELSTQKVEGFIPGSTSVMVATTATARYFSNRGVSMTKAEFFAALTTAGFAEAEGAYNEATNTLTAHKIKLEDGGENEGDENESEVSGPASDVDKSGFTFKITVQQFEGILIQPGTVLTVVIDGGTEYKKSSRDAFFAALANGSLVEVKGELNGTTITADRLKLEDGDGGGDDNGGDDDGGDDN
jgi:hypothetical protein